MRYVFNLVLLAFITTGCGSTNNINKEIATVSSKYKKLAEEELNTNVRYVSNKSGTSILCIGGKKKLGQTFSFFVYSNIQQLKITETFNNVVDVKWVDDETIKYKYLSGIVNVDGEGQKYITIKLQ